jgi:Na+-translocating ferredoxin:NAD+ oxidoreductase subunit G
MSATKPLDALWYQAGSLGLVALLATAALAVAHQATAPRIAQAQAQDLALSLSRVLPEGFADNAVSGDFVDVEREGAKPLRIYRPRKEGVQVGVIFQVVGKGYAGPIDILMGVDAKGQLTGVRVLRHTETPGLGDKIEAQRDDWVLSFNGKSLEDPPPAKWAVKKEGGVFDQFAGATITPRAVVNAVREGLQFYQAQRHRLFENPQAPQTDLSPAGPASNESVPLILPAAPLPKENTP